MGFCPLFIAVLQSEVVDDVKKAESVREQEHNLVGAFHHSDFTCCVGKALREVSFYQVQSVSPGGKLENRHLVIPFLDFGSRATYSGIKFALTFVQMFSLTTPALP